MAELVSITQAPWGDSIVSALKRITFQKSANHRIIFTAK